MNRKLLPTLFLGVLMAALDIAVLGPALPALRVEFGLGPSGSAWLVTLYVLGNLVGTPILGALSDRWGRGRAYRVSVGLFALGSALILAAPNLLVLLAARALQGFGAGGIFPVAAATIGDVVPPERQGRVLGAIGATFGIAFLLGPPLGALVLAVADWRWIFGLNLPLSALVLVWSMHTLPNQPSSTNKPIDLPGIAAFTGGLSLLAVAASTRNLVDNGLARLSLALLGVGLLALLPSIESRSPHPFLPISFLKQRKIALPLLLGLGAGLGEVGTMFLPDHAVRSLGVEPARAGFLLTALVVGLTIGAPTAGRLTDRFGARPVLFVGALLQALGLGVFGLDTTPTDMTWHLGGALLGLGMASLLGAPLRVALLHNVPKESKTMAQSLLSVAHAVGQIGTASLLAAITLPHPTASTSNHQPAFLASALLGLLLIPLTLLLPPALQRNKPTSTSA